MADNSMFTRKCIKVFIQEREMWLYQIGFTDPSRQSMDDMDILLDEARRYFPVLTRKVVDVKVIGDVLKPEFVGISFLITARINPPEDFLQYKFSK